VLLVDRKNRRHLVRLADGGSFHTHAGIINHDTMIGGQEGVLVEARPPSAEPAKRGVPYLVIRPTLADLVLEMPRGAQVIYPKDLGAILMSADVFPGARVIEAGVGSGALAMALLRAGASLTSYELRPDFAATARRNVSDVLATTAPAVLDWKLEERDIYEGIEGAGYDRVVLDLPEPWRVVEHAERALVTGGIFLAYLPTINQTAELRARLDESRFGMAETSELLRRTWHVEGRSVRPDHRMVAHTGFLTTARLLNSRAAGFSPSR
jgi:tRNA (adenine57-N1/adenine58-N1)-methyltransferase